MEGADLHIFYQPLAAKMGGKAFAHLVRRLVGKGYGCDVGGRYTAIFYQVCDPIDQRAGLAGARAGDDGDRRGVTCRCLPLLVV